MTYSLSVKVPKRNVLEGIERSQAMINHIPLCPFYVKEKVSEKSCSHGKKFLEVKVKA